MSETDYSLTHTWDDPDVIAGRKLWVEMRTPEGPVYSGHGKYVQVPATKGSMGVLPRHAPLMSSLEPGFTLIRDPVGAEWRFVTGNGFVEIFHNRVLVLVDFAEAPERIDVERARAARDRARARLRSPGEDVDLVRAQASLDRALVRLRHAREG